MPIQRSLLAITLALTLSACGGAQNAEGGLRADGTADPTANSELAMAPEGMSTNGMSTNGLSTNGLSTNGMSTNGLSTNGLALNGLSAGGLQSSSFAAWFSANGASYSNMVMTYLVRCALPGTASLSYRFNGATYTWAGNLGLAPQWAAGQAIPLAEQQLISGCLAAHANRFGVDVPISVRAFNEDGVTQIATSNAEKLSYSVREGCFFGNLFNGEGVASAYEDSQLSVGANSSYRACAWGNGGPGLCSNITSSSKGHQCSAICTPGPNQPVTDVVWSTCKWKGKSYAAVSTRILPSWLNTCGDGICEPTETCYDRSTGYGCYADCGKCSN